MQKILIIISAVILSSCMDENSYPVSPPEEMERSITVYSYPPVVYIETRNNEFCVDESERLEYNFINPITSYQIDSKNKENFYSYCDGYNSAVKTVRLEYINHVKFIISNLNKKYKNLQYLDIQKILIEENKKLANDDKTIMYILNTQRCQYGFITKVKTIIPILYLRESFSYELKQSGWYVGYQ